MTTRAPELSATSSLIHFGSWHQAFRITRTSRPGLGLGNGVAFGHLNGVTQTRLFSASWTWRTVLPDVLAVLRDECPLDHHFAGLVACIAFDDADPTRDFSESEQCFAYPMISSPQPRSGDGPDGQLVPTRARSRVCRITLVSSICGGLLAPHFKSLAEGCRPPTSVVRHPDVGYRSSTSHASFLTVPTGDRQSGNVRASWRPFEPSPAWRDSLRHLEFKRMVPGSTRAAQKSVSALPLPIRFPKASWILACRGRSG